LNKKIIGILGGTFDPVHYGHLRLALDVKEHYALDEVRLMPCKIPPHKTQLVASEQQRLNMLQLAILNEPSLTLDTRELHRAGPSYTIDTLTSLRTEFGTEHALCLIMGFDAFLSLPTWHRFDELIGLAHLIVMQRPGFDMASLGQMRDFYQTHCAVTPAQLRQQPSGLVSLFAARQMAISASEIREKIRERHSVRYLLPDSVWDYIDVHDLYRN
jgi:nicotinate-nucleotide adenylyltransferase